jgi:hypothetical protein
MQSLAPSKTIFTASLKSMHRPTQNLYRPKTFKPLNNKRLASFKKKDIRFKEPKNKSNSKEDAKWRKKLKRKDLRESKTELSLRKNAGLKISASEK